MKNTDKPQQSLRELLENLAQVDDDLPPEEFDPAAVVGDLKEKVDAIKWRLDEWEAKAKIADAWAQTFKARADSLRRKAEKLEDYVVTQMEINGYETLPGNLMRVDLHTTKSVECLTKATPELYLQFNCFMRQETSYNWDKKAIKEALEKGEKLEFATLKQGKHPRFFLKKE